MLVRSTFLLPFFLLGVLQLLLIILFVINSVFVNLLLARVLVEGSDLPSLLFNLLFFMISHEHLILEVLV